MSARQALRLSRWGNELAIVGPEPLAWFSLRWLASCEPTRNTSVNSEKDGQKYTSNNPLITRISDSFDDDVGGNIFRRRTSYAWAMALFATLVGSHKTESGVNPKTDALAPGGSEFERS